MRHAGADGDSLREQPVTEVERSLKSARGDGWLRLALRVSLQRPYGLDLSAHAPDGVLPRPRRVRSVRLDAAVALRDRVRTPELAVFADRPCADQLRAGLLQDDLCRDVAPPLDFDFGTQADRAALEACGELFEARRFRIEACGVGHGELCRRARRSGTRDGNIATMARVTPARLRVAGALRSMTEHEGVPRPTLVGRHRGCERAKTIVSSYCVRPSERRLESLLAPACGRPTEDHDDDAEE